MKVALFLILISSYSLLSQWTIITYSPVIPSRPYALNGDSVYVFRNKVGWYKSYNSGDGWVLDNEIFKSQDGKIIYPHDISPIFDDNNIYFFDENTLSLQISKDYGITFNKAKFYEKDKINEKIPYEMSVLKEFNDTLYCGMGNGLYISTDKGYNWFSKNSPGFITFMGMHNGEAVIFDPEEDGVDEHLSEIQNILFFDNSLFINTSMNIQYGGIFKTVDYNYNDINKTKYYPITRDYFLRNYDHNIKVKGFGISSFKSKDIFELNGIIYTLFHSSHFISPGSYSNIWYSEDKGISWIELDLSKYGINLIREVRKCGDIVYVLDGETGVYMSDDNLKTFTRVSTAYNINSKEFIDINDCINIQFSDNYAYLQTNLGLCRAPIEDCKIVSDINSVNNQYQTEFDLLYPNPTSDIINIDIETPTNIRLFDIFGNKLLEDYNTKLDISHLSSGTYYINLNMKIYKIIKL